MANAKAKIFEQLENRPELTGNEIIADSETGCGQFTDRHLMK
nr:hypothetical protein [Klebsiella pneumoniae]